jgi:enamine deaminase RidA (YjgF/YER057c/UK114 family)
MHDLRKSSNAKKFSEVKSMSDAKRTSVSSGTKWEAMAGYARAVRVGDVIHVSGTTATDENGNLVGANAAEQARYAIQKIERALNALGGNLRDVVRTRVFVSDIQNWEAVARVHGEFFHDIRPANTLVEAKLVAAYLVEIEAEAIVTKDEG